MKKTNYGPARYYVTDKNIFDALNQPKVDATTLADMFERRNILVSRHTPRERTAQYFSRLTHDYFDHTSIAERLGIIAKRERITSQLIVGAIGTIDLQLALSNVKANLEAGGDVVQITKNGNDISVNVEYSVVDYKRNEFAQVQVRDGTISFIKTTEGYVVRNTQNEYLNSTVDSIVGALQTNKTLPIARQVISLFDVVHPKLRSRFFHELATSLPNFQTRDVTDVFVYKTKPSKPESDSKDTSDPEADTHIERVLLRGNGVTRSELLSDLFGDDYYIVKIGWLTKEIFGEGHTYDIEALFTNPQNCTGFSFIVSGVYERQQDGKTSKRGRAPRRDEVEKIANAVELKARALVASLAAEAGVSPATDSK